MTDKKTEALKQALEALELALDNLHDHGDNCFLHDEGEYNICFCGKDSLSNHLQSIIEKLDEALTEQPAEQRPQNCGTGFCSCIECPYVQPAQQPVAWLFTNVQSGDIEASTDPYDKQGEREYWHPVPLYTSPSASKPWVWLTKEEILEINDTVREQQGWLAFVRAIEIKLKEKNT